MIDFIAIYCLIGFVTVLDNARVLKETYRNGSRTQPYISRPIRIAAFITFLIFKVLAWPLYLFMETLKAFED